MSETKTSGKRHFFWDHNRSLKTKLCVLTVLLIVAMMFFVTSVVITQQRNSLLLQMKGTGSFLVQNLAKNVVGPLLDEDSLSLNNLITSLEARDREQGNPARFTLEEYDTLIAQFFLEDKLLALKPFIQKQEKNIYFAINKLSLETLTPIGTAIFLDVVKVLNTLNQPAEYQTFFEQYPWTRAIFETLTTQAELGGQIIVDAIPEQQRADLISKLCERLLQEILSYVKNPFIGYAIVVDKKGIIQAHPDIGYLGQTYHWPDGATPLREGDELKVQAAKFKGELHFDFAAPVIVRDKNLGAAYIGTVHIGLRQDYILRDISAAKQKMLYLTLAAVLLGSAGSYVLASLFVKPIQALVNDAKILGSGNLDYQIQSRSHDEVGVLAMTLDDARLKLRDAQEKMVANERLARELEIAREIQMALLPQDTPVLENVEVGTLYRAASQVGGDLYDFFWVSEDELGIVVADVSGKGVPGSLVMTMVKAVIRAKAIKSDAREHRLPSGEGGDPASVIRKTNQMIVPDIKKGMFVTATYGILNVKTLQFHFVSAGHNDTLVYNSRTQELREYNPKGIALGLDKGSLFDMILQDLKIPLASGDLLLQYTDGITEAMDKDHEEFGDQRLKETMQKYAHQNVNDFLQSLDQEIRAFTKDFAQSDDITAVAIKVK